MSKNQFYMKLTTVLSLMSLMGCGIRKNATATSISNEEYEIYSMLLEPEYAPNFPASLKHRVLYVRDTTVFPRDWRGFESWPMDRRFGGVPVPALDSTAPAVTIKKDTLSGWVEAGSVFSHLEMLFPLYDWKAIKWNFDSINSTRYRLNSQLISCSIPVHLVNRLEFQEACEADTTDYKRECILTQYSRIGFDRSKTIAIVYYECGRSGGGGSLYQLMKRGGDRWTVLRTIVEPYL